MPVILPPSGLSQRNIALPSEGQDERAGRRRVVLPPSGMELPVVRDVRKTQPVMRPRSESEEITAQATRQRIDAINLIQSILGKDVARFMSGDEKFYDTLPQRRVPKNMKYVRNLGDRWVNEYDEVVPEPPSDFLESTSIGEEFTEDMFRYTLGYPKHLQTLLSGDPQMKMEAFDNLMEDAGFALMFGAGSVGKLARPILGKVGEGVLKEAGQGFRKGLGQVAKTGVGTAMHTPRFAIQGLEKITGVPFTKMGEGIWENIFVPASRFRFLPTGEGAKSIAEVLQPAVERLEKVGLDKPFRDLQAQKQHIANIGQEIGNKIAKMKPSERLEAMKALRGLPTESRIMEDVEAALEGKGVNPTYHFHFKKALEKATRKVRLRPDSKIPDDILADEALYDVPSVKGVFEEIDSLLDGKRFSHRRAQKALKKVVDNPAFSDSYRILARDLYNLHLDSVQAFTEASRRAGKKFLTDGLEQRGIVKAHIPSSEPEEEWMRSTFPGLKGMYVPRDVELELRTLEKVPKLANNAFNKWFVTPWKTSKVILRPATHMRNLISNAILNDWGGLPFWRGDVYLDAYKQMRGKGKYWKEWERLTGGGGTFSVSELDEVTRGLRADANIFDHGLATFNRFARVPRAFYNAEEQWSKMAKYIWNRKKGMDPREAALDAMKWTFNYGEVTRAVAGWRQTGAPFFTWQSKVIPLMAETFVKHPVRIGKWMAFYKLLQQHAVNNVDISNEEWEHIHSTLPEYIQDGQFLLMPWRDAEGRLQMLNLTYIIPGFGDMAEMSSNPSGWLLGHPAFSIAGTIMTKTQFSGAPLYYDWESPKMKALKTFGFVWDQLMPSWMLGGTDWDAIYDSISNDPEAMTWEQVAAGMAGFKIKPIDPMKQARRHRAVEMIHRSQIGGQMRRELRRARSPEQRREIVERFQRDRRRLRD